MPQQKVIHLLGGGQLGRMFIENALRYDVAVHVLDPDPQAPCAHIARHFQVGRFDDHDTVMAFAEKAEVVSIEIEHVSISALRELKAKGIPVIPDPEVLNTINDKGLQKEFYREHGIPTLDFTLCDTREEVLQNLTRPAFLKARTGGYDGRGVMAIDSDTDHGSLIPGPYVLEAKAAISKELAVVGVRSASGGIALFPVVEMVFDPALNLVDHLIAPADVPENIVLNAMDLAQRTIDAFNSPGIFAVELFLLKTGELVVNETAPRLHNSGHFSMEACASSQFDQLMRVLMDWPLGSTAMAGHAGMVNLVGEGGTGPMQVLGMDGLLRIPSTFMHLYGKHETRSGRKMGHVNVLRDSRIELEKAMSEVKHAVRIVPVGVHVH